MLVDAGRGLGGDGLPLEVLLQGLALLERQAESRKPSGALLEAQDPVRLSASSGLTVHFRTAFGEGETALTWLA